MFTLFIMMMERVGLIILLAFLLVNVSFFKKILLNRQLLSAKIKLIAIFATFAIISNFTGIVITDNQLLPGDFSTVLNADTSIANTRTLAIGVAGIIGGPFVGVGVGIIAGIHRVMQAGGTSFFYIVSSILVGCLAGYIGRNYIRLNKMPSTKKAFLLGTLMESIQMVFILFFSPTLEQGWLLVRFIAVPMILLNAIGTLIFITIISSTQKQEEQLRAVQTHDVLDLAAKTLPYFREGLTQESCGAVAKIIQKYTKVAAISMTDNHQILAHVGVGSDHHIPELDVMTSLSLDVLQTGHLTIARSKSAIGCSNPNCRLHAAIVIPLKSNDQIAGTLKMYFTDVNDLTHVEENMAEGLATIFSSQLELGEIEAQSKLLKDAEIKSLQAQVNPHFFFNAMNTIAALMRRDVTQSRQLLLQLSQYFRSNLQGARQTTITLEQELAHINAYLALEQARFPNRYTVSYDIEEGLESLAVPPFCLQVLVENAIRHAFHSRKTDNLIRVTMTRQGQTVRLCVRDNGFGINPEKYALLGHEPVPSVEGTGTALENLNKRLAGLFGPDSTLHFTTTAEGTRVTFKLPFERNSDTL